MEKDQRLSRTAFLEAGLRHSGRGLRDWVSGLLGYARDRAPAVSVIRPPGALREPDFLAACTRCDACAGACPTYSIRIAQSGSGVPDGTPYMHDLAGSPCVLCPDMPCIAACESGALAPRAPEDVRMGLAVVDEATCLAHAGTPCRACVDACPLGTQAIVAHAGRPMVVPLGCAGCGTCLAACPAEPRAMRVVATA